jgi:uncharacterized protein YbjT (DUF2867 family)
MIVVTAPTGHIGSRLLLTELLRPDQPGETVRVVARDPARLPEAVRDRVEVVTGSHHTRTSSTAPSPARTPCSG